MDLQCEHGAPVQPAASVVDLKSDLEGLDPTPNVRSIMEGFEEKSELLSRKAGESAKELVAMEPSDADLWNVEAGTRWYESTPELDTDSESGHSIMEELQAPHLSPGTFSLQPMDLNDRFTSSKSDVDETGLSNFGHVHKNETAQADEDMFRSRFSWGSSVYSNPGQEPVGEGAAWWKPVRPLVVRKENPQPPPVPERNPLRLLRRKSKSAPIGFGENARASRNTLDLHLDLSNPIRGDVRKSVKSPNLMRMRSYTTSVKKNSISADTEATSNNVVSDHIFDAMHSSRKSLTRNGVENAAKLRLSVNSARSKVPSRSRSHRDVSRTSGYAEKVMSARGHTRGASEPFRNSSVRNTMSSKWDAAMPSHNTIRRSCISSLINESNVKRPVQRLAINKELPPLPVALQSP